MELAAPADPREFGRAAAAAPPAAAGETVASAPPPPSERQVPALQSMAFTADAPGARPQIPGGAVQPETSPATTGADAAGLEAGLPALAGPAREEPPKAATQGQSTQPPAPSPTMRANTAADIAAGAAVRRLEPAQALPGPAEDEAGSESDLRAPIPLDPAPEARTGPEGPEVRIALPGLAEKVPDAATGPSPALSGSADPIALRETPPEGVMVAASDPVARAPEAAPAGSAPSPSSDPGRSVAMQLAAAVTADREGGFEVRLSPEELGVVKLTLHVGDGAVTLAIQAERPETLDLLRRSVDVLEREFRDAGFTSLNLSFGHGGGDRPARGASAYSAVVLDRPDAAGTAPHPSAPHGRAPSSSQLDLRL